MSDWVKSRLHSVQSLRDFFFLLFSSHKSILISQNQILFLHLNALFLLYIRHKCVSQTVRRLKNLIEPSVAYLDILRFRHILICRFFYLTLRQTYHIIYYTYNTLTSSESYFATVITVVDFLLTAAVWH